MSEVNSLDAYADRRRHLRKPVNRNAELTLRTGEDFFDCTVIDESAGGVQVELAEEIDLPEEVVIRFSVHASQLVRRCWSLGTRVGYQFIDTAPATRRTVEDVPPPASAAAPTRAGDFACITPAALGLHCAEMAFEYPAQRISALLRMSLFEKSDAKTFITSEPGFSIARGPD